MYDLIFSSERTDILSTEKREEVCERNIRNYHFVHVACNFQTLTTYLRRKCYSTSMQTAES